MEESGSVGLDDLINREADQFLKVDSSNSHQLAFINLHIINEF
jgi:hypothetical protein